MSIKEIDIHSALKQYFGFSKFKGLQEEVIESVVAGDRMYLLLCQQEVVNHYVINFQH